jgi:hypothetical protein
MTFAAIYDFLVHTGRIAPATGRLFVVYPDGFIRSRVLSVNSDIGWVDQSAVEGARFELICDIKSQFLGIYKATGWELNESDVAKVV